MNRFLIYLLVIFTYLGISKSFYPNKQVTVGIPSKEAIEAIFKIAPVSIILVDMDEVGLIMKTYLMKYMLVSGYQDPVSVTIKTNKKFWEESKNFIGMSIFRRKENENDYSFTPMPPGFHFIGDSSYGYWRKNKDTNEKEWFFYRSFSNLKKYFYYGDYRPTHQMIKEARKSARSNKPYFGLNNEFGMEGTLTRKNLNAKIFNKKKFKVDYEKHFSRFISN